MIRPARGGCADRTWIRSLESELEVVCTIAPPWTYRTGMITFGGRASGWCWVGVAPISIHLGGDVMASSSDASLPLRSFRLDERQPARQVCVRPWSTVSHPAGLRAGP